MKKVGRKVIVMMLIPCVLNAGYIIKEKVKSSGFTGEKEDVQFTYISETGIRIEDSQKITIMKVLHGKVKMYIADKLRKTYRDMSTVVPMMVTGFLFILNCDQNKCEVDRSVFRPTNEFKMIGNWKARKVIIKLKGVTREQISWYTKDFPELIKARKLWSKFVNKVLKILAQREERLKDVLRILEEEGNRILREYGVDVRREVNVMGMKTVSRVVEVKEEEISPSLLTIPSDYRKVEMNVPHFPQ